MLNAALESLQRGWAVFPLQDKRTPLIAWKKYQKELPTEHDVRLWWAQHPQAWIGVALGEVSKIVRIDADGPVPNEWELPPTYEFTSPSGGRGWLYKHTPGIKTEVLWRGEGPHEELRVQSTGAYTVVPPSQGYIWNGAEIAPPPNWLYFKGVANVADALEAEIGLTIRQPDKDDVVEALKHIPSDAYDDWLYVGFALHSMGSDWLPVWTEWSRTSSKFVEGECERKWNSFVRRSKGVSGRYLFYLAKKYDGWKPANAHEPLTDIGNAKVLARMGVGKIAHSAVWGWMAWDGKRWTISNRDAEKRVQELQKTSLEYRFNRAFESFRRHMLSDARADDYKDKAKQKQRTLQQIRMHESHSRVLGARHEAESEPLLSVDYQEFNQYPMLLNCNNSVLNLVTGETTEFDPTLKLTQLCPTDYDKNAVCPTWEWFVADVFSCDATLVRWTQKLLGYCITGQIKEHILPVLYGEKGRNGKSTLINTIINVLGPDYACVLPSGFLVEHKNERHQTEQMLLHNRRFVADIESGDSLCFNSPFVKRITGGDQITARYCHRDYDVPYKPTHKLLLGTNSIPAVRGIDPALWSRLLIIRFLKSYLGHEDLLLPMKLQQESQGILRWLVDGCFMWQREGLSDVPTNVRLATQETEQEQNTGKRWINECTTRAPGERLRKQTAVASYSAWCTVNRVRQISTRHLGDIFREMDIEVDHNYFVGVRLAVPG